MKKFLEESSTLLLGLALLVTFFGFGLIFQWITSKLLGQDLEQIVGEKCGTGNFSRCIYDLYTSNEILFWIAVIVGIIAIFKLRLHRK